MLVLAEPQPAARDHPHRDNACADLEISFRDHFQDVLSYAGRRTASPQAAEDVAAEVFAIASRRPGEIPKRPLGWLIGVARNVISNHYRSEQRKAALRERLMAEARPEATEQVHLGLADALVELTDDDREILLLRYWDGLSGAEVAAAMSCSLPATYVRLHRARGRLAGLLWGPDHLPRAEEKR